MHSNLRLFATTEAMWVGLFAVFAGIAWLIPDHYLPWTAFHSDLATAMGLAMAAMGAALSPAPIRIPVAAAVAFLASLVPVAQHLSGHVHFAGDAWLATLYLVGFGLAIVVGRQLMARNVKSIEPLMWALVIVGLVSVWLAASQWLSLDDIGIPMMRLVRGARPYANLGQPNQLATLLMLAVVAAVLLFEWQRLGPVALAGVSAVLLFGVALTASRTAWVEMTGLALWVWAFRDRARLRLSRGGVIAMAMVLAVFVLLLPTVDQWLLVAGAHSAQIRPVGIRPIHWATVADAIAREPWFGYGWNQVSVAVARVALDHPAPHEMIEHSHNFVLDLMVWNGVPIALMIILCVGGWVWHHGVRSREATSTLLAAMVGVTLVHSMFEFPLEYAYLLLPIGVMVGALEAIRPFGPVLAAPRWSFAAVAGVAVATTAWVAVEYVQVEESSRALRLESARIGPSTEPSQAPDLKLLTQQRDYLRFARTQARRGMTDEQLHDMRRVAERFGHPPVLFRFAMACALNGLPREASDTLRRLCLLHSPSTCLEASQNWRSASEGAYPELREVGWPVAPTTAVHRQ